MFQVRAFGLNRSEMFTRLGHSPNVTFPRILGIEAVGEIADPADSGLAEGDTVATAMGGMGRSFDGGYAEYTLVPTSQVQKINTALGWAEFGALPEMVQNRMGIAAHRTADRVRRELARSRWNDLGRPSRPRSWPSKRE